MLQGSQVLNIPINFGMAGQLIHVLDSLQDYLPPEKGLAEIIELRDVIRSWCNALASEHQAVGFRMPVVSQWRRTIAAHIKHLVALWSRQETDDKRLQSLFKMGVQLLSGMLPDIQPVQDDYSFRCAPQVLGAALAALEHAAQVVTIEINAATDNPLIFPPDMAAGSLEEYRSKLNREQLEAAVCSGGNFHGEIIALCMDYLAIALAEVGSIAERRIAHLVDQNVSNGLPAFLVLTSGSNSGFMLAQYTAAALVSENKCLAHPAGVDSIPTSANTEDHVSMGTISARKARQILEHVEIIVAIELLCAAQGMDLRAPLRVAPRCDQARSIIRREIPFLDRDRPLYKDIEAATHLVRGRILSGLLEE
ncbi:aromatic amino acid lyase [bacterium]|nr:aromatic amino acid lyase [candidate division CSSED10-310 bacterium]